MRRLINLELLKNLNYRPFKIFTGIYFIVLVALLFIGLVNIQLGPINFNLKNEGIYNFPEIWNFTTWIVAIFKIFLGLIIIFSITQEFSNRMFKQNTIDGLSRAEFVSSKVITITGFTLISTALVFILTLFIGYTYSENTETALVTAEMFFIGNYFVKLFTFFCFLMFLSVLLRKSMFVFLSVIGWQIVEWIFIGLEHYTRFESALTPAEQLEAAKAFKIINLLPLESMSSLITNPIMRLKTAQKFGMEYTYSYPTESLIACILWAAIFILGSFWILKKRDW